MTALHPYNNVNTRLLSPLMHKNNIQCYNITVVYSHFTGSIVKEQFVG